MNPFARPGRPSRPGLCRPGAALVPAITAVVIGAAVPVAAGFPALAGSAAGGAAQRTENRILAEIRQIQSQLSELTEAQDSLTEAVETLLRDRQATLSDERRSRAETGTALERMEREISTLGEALGQANDRISALLVEVESVREAQRRAAFAGMTGMPAAAGEDAGGETDGDRSEALGEDAPTGEAAEEGGGAAAEGGETGAESVPAGEEAVVLDEPSISEVYLEAQADYLQGRYELAVAGFEQVAAAGGELADNARYGIGDALLAVVECLPDCEIPSGLTARYGIDKSLPAGDLFKPALEQFEMVIRDFPESNKVGEAWYKKGLILHRLGHESDAREIFEDILDVYPGTPAARAARRQLESLTPPEPGD